MPRLLFIAYDFPPASRVGGLRAEAFYRGFIEAGWDVELFTVPVSEYGGAVDLKRQDQRPANAYEIGTAEPTKLKRLLSRLRLSRLGWFFLFPFLWERQARWKNPLVKAALARHRQKPFDLVLTTSIPFVTALAGEKIKQALSVPWIADLRDPFSRFPGRLWPSWFHYKWMQRVESRALGYADRVTVTSATTRDRYLEDHHQLSENSMKVIFNGFPDSMLKPPTAISSGDDYFNIVHTGTLRFQEKRPGNLGFFGQAERLLTNYQLQTYYWSGRSPKPLFEALVQLFKAHPEYREVVRANFYGDVDLRNRDLAKSLGVDDVVHFFGPVPYEEAVEKVWQADLLYLPIERPNDGRECEFINAKSFEYMASGRPILLVGDACEGAEIVEKAGNAKRFAYEEVSGISSFLKNRLYGQGAKLATDRRYVEYYKRSRLASEMVELAQSLL